MKTSLALLFAFAAIEASAAQPLDYRFDAVKRTLMLKSSGKESRAVKGAHASGGDRVETGWFSSAVIASADQRAQFQLFSATEVTLAQDTPGVILSLERGRIRAAFDKITGSEPRIVQTPGALLAVRGTQFDVEVDREGNTIVDVFEGLVEVRSPLQHEPLFVKPGEQANFGRDRAPRARPIPEQRRRERDPNRERQQPQTRDGANPPQQPQPRDGGADRGGRRGGDGGGQQRQAPPPPRPPESI